jgi:hypothetical protein
MRDRGWLCRLDRNLLCVPLALALRETSRDCSRAVARRSFSRFCIAGMVHARWVGGYPKAVGAPRHRFT